MKPAVIVVFFDLERTSFSPKPPPYYLRPLPDGRCGLERLLGGLKRLGFPVLAPANGSIPPSLATILRRSGAAAIPLAPGTGYLEACQEALARRPAKDVLLCRPEAFFLSPDLARAQLREHRRSGCRYSYCVDLPFGAAPEIFSAGLLRDMGGFWQDFGPHLGGCLLAHRRLYESQGALGIGACAVGAAQLYPSGRITVDDERAWRRARAAIRSRKTRIDDVVRRWRAADAAAAVSGEPARPRPAPQGRKMRVAHLFPRSDFHGGVQEAAASLLLALDRSRFEPLALCPEPGPVSRSLAAHGVPCGFFGLLPAWRYWSLDHGAIAQPERLAQRRRVLDWLRSVRPALLHCHGFDRLIAEAAAAAGVPVILHAHGYLHVPNPYPPSLFAARWDYGYELRLADRFLAVSRGVAVSLRWLGIPPSRITTIHNGVDLERFSPRKGDGAAFRRRIGAQAARPLVVSIGRLDANRRLEVLLAAFKRLTGRFPSARLALVGEASFEGYEARLRKAVLALGLEDCVVLPGPCRDVADVLAAADVVVDPRPLDPCPLSVLEAMASGRPVVAVADGGCAELIEHGRSGLLVPPEDAASLARAIERLAAAPKLAERLGLAARRRAEARFDWRRQARLVQGLYERLAT